MKTVATRWIVALFVAACAVQAAVPLAIVWRAERTRAHGEIFRFRCAPVDPYDPFRGRYVTLAFDVETERVPVEASLAPGDHAWATLAAGDDGFARITDLSPERPADVPAVRVRLRSVRDGAANVELPFDRYFMNEAVAPEAERAWREAVSRRDVTAHAEVRVRDGDAALVGLRVDDVPIEDYVRRLAP